ncbi:hypothetical protein LCGC14_1225470 [marine sediment metagenome]|uniref:Uncharacterized protein n=1 Tax=marine sediment metagenome TaxID=412755 RepID=A0A0F9PEG6_9ZZZZ
MGLVDEIVELKDRVSFLEQQVVELLRGSHYGGGSAPMQRRIDARVRKENRRLTKAISKQATEDKVLPALQRMSQLHVKKMKLQRIPGTPGDMCDAGKRCTK